MAEITQDERRVFELAQKLTTEQLAQLTDVERREIVDIAERIAKEAPAEKPPVDDVGSFLLGRDVSAEAAPSRGVQVPQRNILTGAQRPGTAIEEVQRGINEVLETPPVQLALKGLQAAAIPITAPSEAAVALLAGEGVSGAAEAFTGMALRSLLPEQIVHSETGIAIPKAFSEKILEDIAKGEREAGLKETAIVLGAQVVLPALVPFSKAPIESVTRKLIGRGINDPLSKVYSVPANPTAADKALADVLNTEERIDFIQKSVQRQREAQTLARRDRLLAEKVAKEAALEQRAIRLTKTPAQRIGDTEAEQLKAAVERQVALQREISEAATEADKVIARRTFGEPTGEPSSVISERLFGKRDPALNIDFVKAAQRERLRELRPQLDEIQRLYGTEVASKVEDVFVASAPVPPMPVAPAKQVLQPYPYDLQSILDRVTASRGIAPAAKEVIDVPKAIEKVKAKVKSSIRSKRATAADKEAMAENVAAALPTDGTSAVVPAAEAIQSAAATEAATAGMPYSQMVRDFFEMKGGFPKFEELSPSKVLDRTRTQIAFDSLTMPRGSILLREGNAGRALVDEFNKVNAIPSTKAGDFLEEIRQVSQQLDVDPGFLRRTFTGAEAQSRGKLFRLADSLQGYGPVTDDIRAAHDMIRKQQRIVASLRQSQDETFQLRTNYMHHDIPFDDALQPGVKIRDEITDYMVHRKAFQTKADAENFVDTYLSAKRLDENAVQRMGQYLKDTKQADSIEDGIRLWKQYLKEDPAFGFGGFKQRVINLPIYDPNPLRVQAGYMQGSLRDLYITERFGKKGELLEAFAAQIDSRLGRSLGEIKAGSTPATTVARYVLGTLPTDETNTFASIVRGVEGATKLQAMAIGNVFQGPVGTLLRTDIGTTFKTLKDYVIRHKQVAQWARRVGQKPEFASVFIDTPGEIMSFLAKVEGVTATEVNNYVLTTTAGRYYADKAFKRLLQNPRNQKWRDTLVRLGVDPDVALQRGNLTVQEYKLAANNLWRQSQAIPDILSEPHRWLLFNTTDPATKSFRQFQSTAFRQAQEMGKFLFKEKNKITNWTKFAVVYPFAGEFINGIKSLALGRERPESLFWRIVEDYNAAFAFGIIGDIIQWSKYGIPVGPFLSDVVTAIELLQNPSRIPEEVVRRTPVPIIGERISKSLKASRKEAEKVKREIESERELEPVE